jgi:hypothetical protein
MRAYAELHRMRSTTPRLTFNPKHGIRKVALAAVRNGAYARSFKLDLVRHGRAANCQ